MDERGEPAVELGRLLGGLLDLSQAFDPFVRAFFLGHHEVQGSDDVIQQVVQIVAERARDLAEILEAKGFVPAGFAPGKGSAVVAGLGEVFRGFAPRRPLQ